MNPDVNIPLGYGIPSESFQDACREVFFRGALI